MTKNSHVVYISDVKINYYIRKDSTYRTERSPFDAYMVMNYIHSICIPNFNFCIFEKKKTNITTNS